MTYRIIFSESALKQLKKLDAKTQERILSVLDRISADPERYIRKLVDDPGYRLRIGDHRAIVDVDEAQSRIMVLKIGHRRNIYI